VCFFVAKDRRRTGLTVKLIQEAVGHAGRKGARIVEDIPWSRQGPTCRCLCLHGARFGVREGRIHRGGAAIPPTRRVRKRFPPPIREELAQADGAAAGCRASHRLRELHVAHPSSKVVRSTRSFPRIALMNSCSTAIRCAPSGDCNLRQSGVSSPRAENSLFRAVNPQRAVGSVQPRLHGGRGQPGDRAHLHAEAAALFHLARTSTWSGTSTRTGAPVAESLRESGEGPGQGPNKARVTDPPGAHSYQIPG